MDVIFSYNIEIGVAYLFPRCAPFICSYPVKCIKRPLTENRISLHFNTYQTSQFNAYINILDTIVCRRHNIIGLYFPRKQETTFRINQSLFSGENKITYFKMSSAVMFTQHAERQSVCKHPGPHSPLHICIVLFIHCISAFAFCVQK